MIRWVEVPKATSNLPEIHYGQTSSANVVVHYLRRLTGKFRYVLVTKHNNGGYLLHLLGPLALFQATHVSAFKPRKTPLGITTLERCKSSKETFLSSSERCMENSYLLRYSIVWARTLHLFLLIANSTEQVPFLGFCKWKNLGGCKNYYCLYWYFL